MKKPAANPLCALLVAVVTLVGLMTADTAEAYVRSMTCGPPPNLFACDEGEEPKPLEWTAGCVVYHVHESYTGSLLIDEFVALTEQAANAWGAPSCSYMSLVYGGLTNEDRVGYLNNGHNVNVVLFRESGWSHQSQILALTSVTYKTSDGHIVDADIELNDEQHTFTTGAEVIVDVLNTLTHEFGHFVGLDHSDVGRSTMYADARLGETLKRDLDQDDIDGVCAVYPESQQTPTCSLDEVGYHDRYDVPAEGCCQQAPRRAPAPAPWALLTCAGAALILRRRRR